MSKLKSLFSYIIVCALLVTTFQCQKNTNTSVDGNTTVLTISENITITPKDIEQIKYVEFALSDAANSKTSDWVSFQNLAIEIENLKKGTLSFFKDDKEILQALIEDLKNEVPESLNRSSILVRISVLETVLYKLDETANLLSSPKEDILEDIEKVLISYNNLIYQINKDTEKESQNIIKP